jgi:hypothetical protein
MKKVRSNDRAKYKWGNSMKLKVKLVCALALSSFLTPLAGAQTAYSPDSGRSPNQIVLSVPVTASVGGRCGFATGGAPNGAYNKDNFDAEGFQQDFAFALNCTGPSRVAVVSQNGGLLTGGAVPAGYVTKAPYNVTLHLVADGGGTVAEATCAVSALTVSAGCSFVGPASTSQGLRLSAASNLQAGSYVRVAAPPYPGPSTLVQGSYSDRLTVTLSAAP